MYRLEKMFQLSASQIASAILQNNRTLINLKGAIAQEHLAQYLNRMKKSGQLEDFERIDKDGQVVVFMYF